MTDITEDIRNRFTLVIGLEVHAQLLTESKAYSSDANEYGNLPNTDVSVVTLAHPGVLPVHNEKVIEYAVKMGLACQCDITPFNFYDRKNYYYPDLPKGYQITQDKTPICRNGGLKIKLKSGDTKWIALTRIHMEEDAGKSMHLPGEEESLIDLNRAGVPLIEIVSEPEMRSAEEAYAYLTEIKRLVKYLEICDGNMEEGSLRCDANISVMPIGATKFGPKVEVKNMNSFRNVVRAIEFERDRQIAMVEAGETIVSETRMFDATTGETYSLRAKENLNDYRYFPEPDLQPFVVTEAYLNEVKAMMPPLPQALFEKFTQVYGLPDYDAGVLTDVKEIALYYESAAQYTTAYKALSNWIMGSVKSHLNELALHINQFPISAERLAGLVSLVEAGKVSYSVAQQKVFPVMLDSPEEALSIAQKLNVIQDSSDDAIAEMVSEVIAKYPQKVEEYRNGKKGLLGMFVGEVMKIAKGKADPKVVNKLVENALNE